MSSIHRSSSRRRKKPERNYIKSTSVEERLLQTDSKIEGDQSDDWITLPSAPTFYPTVEEFSGNPVHYINSIRSKAEKYGICKIVPPAGWNPPFCVDMQSSKTFETKEQLLNRIQEGIAFGDGEEYTPAEYEKMATEMSMKWRDRNYPNSDHNKMNPDDLERDYWKIVDNDDEDEVAVEYGNDIDTTKYWSGFPSSERGRCLSSSFVNRDKSKLPEPKFATEDFYKESWWNLNNIPFSPDGILRHVQVGINGINVPWLYFGCLFSTFCWHNEDNYLYSINYHHKGSPKLWYGVPGTRHDAEGLERVFKNYLSMKMRDVPDLLQHITTMLSPKLLLQGNVPVYKLLQNAGEYVVTFPRAFHSGFSMGPNIGEAVNFAAHDWISHGADANERYRAYARAAVFSHDRLTFTMANHLEEQRLYSSCLLLLEELRRVIGEEVRLRKKLIENDGVKDVSNDINLPKNKFDRLDEESADYDDKRLCHACKHVCFFSAVACECSQSRVSCLRHSHFMCRCPVEKKYLLIWSTEEELEETLERTESHCTMLKIKEENSQPDKTNQISPDNKATNAAEKNCKEAVKIMSKDAAKLILGVPLAQNPPNTLNDSKCKRIKISPAIA